MTKISDALELFTAQHEAIEAALAAVHADPAQVPALADAITDHLTAEHEVLYPALAGRVPPAVRAELVAEHAAIKRVLADLLWLDADDDRFAATLTKLSALLADHGCWQDDGLFVQLAETVPPGELAALATQVHALDVSRVPIVMLAA